MTTSARIPACSISRLALKFGATHHARENPSVYLAGLFVYLHGWQMYHANLSPLYPYNSPASILYGVAVVVWPSSSRNHYERRHIYFRIF
jgi:hypothetical protein